MHGKHLYGRHQEQTLALVPATSLENQTVAWCLKHTAMTSKTLGREADHRNDGQPKYGKILESPSRQPREERQTKDRGEGLPGWRTRGVVEA